MIKCIYIRRDKENDDNCLQMQNETKKLQILRLVMKDKMLLLMDNSLCIFISKLTNYFLTLSFLTGICHPTQGPDKHTQQINNVSV